MALRIIANYTKRLGLPAYSSHQFSVTVETELNNTDDVKTEASRLYKTLQTAVDRDIQITGFVPDAEYGADSDSTPAKEPATKPSRDVPWKASDKQKQLIMRLIQDNGLELEELEALADKMSPRAILPTGWTKYKLRGLRSTNCWPVCPANRRVENQPPANRWNSRAAR